MNPYELIILEDLEGDYIKQEDVVMLMENYAQAKAAEFATWIALHGYNHRSYGGEGYSGMVVVKIQSLDLSENYMSSLKTISVQQSSNKH